MKISKCFEPVLICVVLVFVMAGCSAEEKAYKKEVKKQAVLAWYPSPLLPPVKDPYVFVWYGLSKKDNWRRIFHSNVCTWCSNSKWLYARGVLQTAWAYGPGANKLNSEDDWVWQYDRYSKSHLAYTMDEWSVKNAKDPENTPAWALKALQEAEKNHPESYSSVYYQGQESLAMLAGEGSLDLLIIEAYMNVHKRFPVRNYQANMEGTKARIDTARKAGAIEKVVAMLGHICKPQDYHPGHELTPEVLDEQIRQLRAYAPEMPGIGFYFERGSKELVMECDRLVYKHFIEPAPDVIIAKPAFEAKLSADKVTIRAEAQAKDNRKVTRYRWFIDNRLMAETSQPQWTWHICQETDGGHFITVHAVDEAFNRAAAQIHVNVQNSRKSKN